jgi:hypothetical protein
MDLSPHSEASKLLEAALEQMDGIIQGAKFEMPNYFPAEEKPSSSTTNGGAGVFAIRDISCSPLSPSSPPPGQPLKSLSPSRFYLDGNGPITVPEALDQLKLAILNDKNGFEVSASATNIKSRRPLLDVETVTFLSRWLRNNPYPKSAFCDDGEGQRRDHDDDQLLALEDRILHADSERDALTLQLNILGEQTERLGIRLHDMEQLLAAKKELLKKTEMALERERKARTAAEEGNRSFGELTRLKKMCSALERENEELRKICAGNKTPKYLNLSPVNRDGGSPENVVSAAKKEVGFSMGKEGDGEIISNDDDVDLDSSVLSSSSGRPPRGLKKIFGKIKRSNSGGQLEDHLKRNQLSAGTPELRRGGFRSTAGGRLGGWQSQGAMRATTAAAKKNQVSAAAPPRRPIAEWNVDMICTWLECLGLGMYSGDVQKTIGTGEELAKMTLSDLEAKLNIKNAMHRKKLALALLARNDSTRSDAEGNLDFQWVLRWLDDIGMPQYKDSFLEARVDGRVLNVLTVDDLFALKVTNQLHHFSIRRGIQVVRQQNFDPACLKRRAMPGEILDASNVAQWTNHRVMEWLKQVDLSEYAPNLRGSGVHGALLVFEPKFNDELMASILSIPASKTLLRRHLSIHFKELVGRDVMGEKRGLQHETNYVPLTPTAKAKPRQVGQFTLKRKKSKSQFDYGDLVCPFAKV